LVFSNKKVFYLKHDKIRFFLFRAFLTIRKKFLNYLFLSVFFTFLNKKLFFLKVFEKKYTIFLSKQIFLIKEHTVSHLIGEFQQKTDQFFSISTKLPRSLGYLWPWGQVVGRGGGRKISHFRRENNSSLRKCYIYNIHASTKTGDAKEKWDTPLHTNHGYILEDCELRKQNGKR